MNPGKPKGRTWLPYLWSLLVGGVVVTAVLLRLAGRGLQSYGSDGAQYIEHTARLRLLKMWQQVGDSSAWRFLFDADAAFPPFMHLFTLPAGAWVGHTAGDATALSVAWLVVLALATGWIATRLSNSPAVAAAAIGGIVLVPALHGYATRYYYDLPSVALCWLAAAVVLAGRDRWPLRAAALATLTFVAAVLTKWATLSFGVPLLLAALVVSPSQRALNDKRPSEALLLNWRSRVMVCSLCVVGSVVMLSGYLQMSGAENSLQSMSATAFGAADNPDMGDVPGESRGALVEALSAATSRAEQRSNELTVAHLVFYPMRLVTSVFSPALSLVLLPLLFAWLAWSRLGWLLVGLLLVGYGGFLLLVMPVLDDRFLVALVPALVLAATFGWAELSERRRQYFAIAVVAVGLLVLGDFHFGSPSLLNREVTLSHPHLPDVPPTSVRGLGASGSVEQRGWGRADRQLAASTPWREALWQVVREQQPRYLGVPGQSELIDPWGDLEWWRYRGLLDQVSGPRTGPEVIAICPPPGLADYEPEEPDLVVQLVAPGSKAQPPSCLSPADWQLAASVADPEGTKEASFWRRRPSAAAPSAPPPTPATGPPGIEELQAEPPPGDVLPVEPI